MAKGKIMGYKAFNSDWTCNGFKYEIGKTYKTDNITICQKGFHFCKSPLDVFNYYQSMNTQKYAIIEASGEIIDQGDKSVCSEIRIVQEISTLELFKANLKTDGKYDAQASGYRGHAQASGCSGHAQASGDSGHAQASGYSGHAQASGDSGHAQASGDSGHARASGYSGHAQASGDRGHAQASGYSGHAQASGYRGHAQASGDSGHAQASGYSGHARASGDRGHAQASGDRGHAQASGYNSVSVSIGVYGKAKTVKSWIVITNWRLIDNVWQIQKVYSRKVGEKIGNIKIESDVWYWFEDGMLKSEAIKCQ